MAGATTRYARAYPTQAQQLLAQLSGILPAGWDSGIVPFAPGDGPIATRDASQKVLNALAPRLPALVGGAADLSPSTKTVLTGSPDFSALESAGRNFHFGVREHAMVAELNGMALHGGLFPYGGTFLTFSDYARGALRLAALQQTHIVLVFTHDSIAMGEDGPTHQPVEHLAALRAIPGFTVIRPADANETAAAWRIAATRKGPTALVLTRQKIPVLDPAHYPVVTGASRGAYVLSESSRFPPAVVLLATGSEVSLALEAQGRLESRQVATAGRFLPVVGAVRGAVAGVSCLRPPPRCPSALDRSRCHPRMGEVRRRGRSVDRHRPLRSVRPRPGGSAEARPHGRRRDRRRRPTHGDPRRSDPAVSAIDPYRPSLGASGPAVVDRLRQWMADDIADRVWRADPTVWPQAPASDVATRTGWLRLPETMVDEIPGILSLADQLRAEGTRHVVLLGMGGSSLAPDVLRRVFGHRPGFPQLLVLDSTHPRAISAVRSKIDPLRSLFIVSSKSGTTTEPNDFCRFFWEQVRDGGADPSGRFIAITDPGSPLEALAHQKSFRAVFPALPTVGGRYSALTTFGLVPAAMIGVDVARLLERARTMAAACGVEAPAPANPGLALGAALGELARRGRDKLTFYASEGVSAFPVWAEQLVAESTGKLGRGIVPVVDEPIVAPEMYGPDRLFVEIQGGGPTDPAIRAHTAALEAAGHPVVRIEVPGPLDLGQEFFRWEFAVAIAGAILEIDPFDQPDVELAKELARRAMAGPRIFDPLPRGGPRYGGWPSPFRIDRCVDAVVPSRRLRGGPSLLGSDGGDDRVARSPPPNPPRAPPGRHDGRFRSKIPALHGPASQGRPEFGSIPSDRR